MPATATPRLHPSLWVFFSGYSAIGKAPRPFCLRLSQFREGWGLLNNSKDPKYSERSESSIANHTNCQSACWNHSFVSRRFLDHARKPSGPGCDSEVEIWHHSENPLKQPREVGSARRLFLLLSLLEINCCGSCPILQNCQKKQATLQITHRWHSTFGRTADFVNPHLKTLTDIRLTLFVTL